MREPGAANGETRRSKHAIKPRNPLNSAKYLCTDFTVHIISKAFESKVNFDEFFSFQNADILKSTIQRHRMVYSALSDELAQGLHALTLKTKTEAEIAMNPWRVSYEFVNEITKLRSVNEPYH